MSDLDGTNDQTTDQQVDSSQAGGEVVGDNPAWEPIRSAVDETTYHLIKPHLAKFDQDAQQRVRSTNERLGWAGKLLEDGMTAEEVQQATTLARQLSEDPMTVFQNLKGYVEQYFPDQFAQLDWIVRQQQAAAAQEDQQLGLDGEDDPRIAELDRRLAELDQREQRLNGFFEEQERQRMYDDAYSQIDTEVKKITAERPDLQKEDWKEIMGYAAAQASQKPVTVAEAVAWFDSIANRVRTTPRPGDSAPSLLPLGGGNPARPQQVDYSKMSDADIQSMIAADMEAKNKQR